MKVSLSHDLPKGTLANGEPRGVTLYLYPCPKTNVPVVRVDGHDGYRTSVEMAEEQLDVFYREAKRMFRKFETWSED